MRWFGWELSALAASGLSVVVPLIQVAASEDTRPYKTQIRPQPHISRPAAAFCSTEACPLPLIPLHTLLSFSTMLVMLGQDPPGLYLFFPTALAPISPIRSYSSAAEKHHHHQHLHTWHIFSSHTKWSLAPPYRQKSLVKVFSWAQ